MRVPTGSGQVRTASQLPVLTMVTGYARWASAVLVPDESGWRVGGAGWAWLPMMSATGLAVEDKVGPRARFCEGSGINEGRAGRKHVRPYKSGFFASPRLLRTLRVASPVRSLEPSLEPSLSRKSPIAAKRKKSPAGRAGWVNAQSPQSKVKR